MKSIIGGREEGGGGAVGVEEEWRRQLRSGNQTGIGQRMEYWRGDGKIGQGPVWGGHMRGKWRKWRLMCYQLCDISFMPQRIGLRPFTLTWGNRNSCAQERNMTTCTWVWLLLMINLTLILIWHHLSLSLKDCKNTDPKMTPSMEKKTRLHSLDKLTVPLTIYSCQIVSLYPF